MSADSMREPIHIVDADAQHLPDAIAVLATAFEDEASTNWILDLSTKSSRRRFAAVMAQTLYHFYARGDTILVALEDDRIVGVAVLAGLGPGRRVSGWPHLRTTLAHLPGLLRLAIHLRWRNLPAAGRAVQPPRMLKKDYHTLEWLAVDPYYQRRGIGQMLLSTLRRREEDARDTRGIYAYTVGDANRAFYERCGYDVLSRVDADPAFIVYHLVQTIDRGVA